MTSQSTDAPRDQAELDQQATAQQVTAQPADSSAPPVNPSAASASRDAATESQNAETESSSAQPRKIKIGSQREGSPRIRMPKRSFVDSSLPSTVSSDSQAPPPAQPVAGNTSTVPAQSSKPNAPGSQQPIAKPPAASTTGGESAPQTPAPQTPATQALATQTLATQTLATIAPITTGTTSGAPLEAVAAEQAAPHASTPPADAPPSEEPPASADEPPSAAPPRKPKSPAVRSAEPVAIPRLNEELDAEVEAALAGVSIADIVARDTAARGETPQTGDELEPDTRRRGIVLRVHREDVFFSLGARHEGVSPLKQFQKPPEPGDQMDVIVARFNADEGLYEVHVPGVAATVGDWSDIADGAMVEARITGSNTGGLECQVNHIRGFIPASQISVYRVENFGEYVGQKLLCVVTEANPQRNNLVLSHRAVLEREKEAARQGLLEQLEPGQTLEGTVRSLRDFGAFVDLGGIDGLIHISKLSWDRVNHPNEVLQEGQRVQVKIEKIDRQSGKIGLSYRDLLEHPWDGIEQKFPVGTATDGVVTRIAQFGAFVKLAPGIEGLVHVSELAHHRVVNVGSLVKEGQTVQVKVLSVDREAQRIGLSMKALQQAPQPASGKKAEEAEDEPLRESAVPKRKGPLKGGLGRSAGGEQFGLNW